MPFEPIGNFPESWLCLLAAIRVIQMGMQHLQMMMEVPPCWVMKG